MENTTTPDGGENESGSVSTSAPQSEPELVEEQEELLEIEDDDADDSEGSGAVAGAFGLTALAFSIVSLGGNWLGTVFGSRSQYFSELHAKTATTQTQSTQISLDAFKSNWHGQAVLGGIFALAAILVGAFVLLSPSLLLSGKSPAWARATALAGIVVGAVGLLLAILVWTSVLAPGLTA
jgi:hypothetical protein